MANNLRCSAAEESEDTLNTFTPQRNRKQKGPRPARRRNSREARVRPSHTRPVNLRERTRCNTSGEIPGKDKVKCDKGKRLSTTKRSKFENRFPIPFLRSLMLKIYERVSRAGRLKTPSSSSSGKRFLSWSANSPQWRKLFSNLSVFN